MIVSHEHGFVFLKTRKTAGTSIEIALSRICGPDDIITSISPEDEVTRRAVGGRGPQLFESPPLPREARNHMRAPGVRKIVGVDRWRSYFKFAFERNPWDSVVSLYYWKYRDREAPTFADFVAEPHIEKLAKNSRIYRVGERVAVDKLCRYESLSEELAAIWARLSLPGEPTLPHAKSYARPSGAHYRDLYTTASAERVRTVFSDVIDDLGYHY